MIIHVIDLMKSNVFQKKGFLMSPVDLKNNTGWTFLTNHSHVLLCLAGDSSMRVRDIALEVGITERAVQRIIADLEEAGYINRIREGRCNTYLIHPDMSLRHPIEEHRRISDLIRLISGEPGSDTTTEYGTD